MTETKSTDPQAAAEANFIAAMRRDAFLDAVSLMALRIDRTIAGAIALQRIQKFLR